MVDMNGAIKVTVTEEKDISIAVCPFCGCSKFLELTKKGDYFYYIKCRHCNAAGPTSKSQHVQLLIGTNGIKECLS